MLLALLAPFSASLDMFVTKTAFDRADGIGFYTNSFFDFIYLYGGLPAAIVAGIAAILLVASFWKPNLIKYRGSCLVLCLTLFFGSLVITHFLLKECWGRPRPRQVVEFGGSQQFRAYYEPLFNSAPEPSKSFPSGHATCGFYFFAFYFLGRRYKLPAIAVLGLVVAIGLGGMLSLARIVQGGHFISDAYVAALIMWLTAYAVDYLVFDAPLFANFRKKFYERSY